MDDESVAVIGAGLFGRLLALRLAAAGHPVSLYERGSLAGELSAGHAAAAMLAPVAEAVTAEPLLLRLGLDSLEQWPVLLQTLPEPVFFQRRGSLIVTHGRDRSELQSFIARLRHRLRAIPLDAACEACDPQRLIELEPELGPHLSAGLYLPAEGQLCNRELFRASQRALQAATAVRLMPHTEVTAIEHAAVNTATVFTAAERHRHRLAIDCRGLGARAVLPELRGVRGEIIRVRAPEVHLRRPIRLLHPRYPLYIVPKPEHRFVIGATEIESEDEAPMTVRSALELLSAAYTVHPGFAEAHVIEMQARCRPAMGDHRPTLRLGPGGIQVNGLYRHGYLVTPALLHEVEASVAALLQGQCSASVLARRRQISPYPELYRPITPMESPSHAHLRQRPSP